MEIFDSLRGGEEDFELPVIEFRNSGESISRWKGVQEMVIYVGLKYGVEKEDPGLYRVTGNGKWVIRNSGIRRPCRVDRENSNRAFRNSSYIIIASD
ncbi:hypothetical protein CDAR_193371 [Caerostris darwini]|uniref:Uncharacterized protein n=1 Tax=Caerostris darwini TaxID=1538125 RepID=A0AAV4RZJ3_9ARAC|nr:hypothetical protein CDAR_193371 [Caerostris darwini]